MATLKTNLTDSEIKKNINNPNITEFYDPRYSLRLRVYKSRTKGAWYYIVKNKWQRLGSYPSLTFRKIVKVLPELLSANLLNNDSGLINELSTTGEVLEWYLGRVLTDANLSESRKVNAKSAIQKHLKPSLANIDIKQISRSVINNKLIWPMQSHLAPSTVKAIFNLLKSAFKQAKKLNLISHNPIETYIFSDFINVTIRAKPSKLKPSDINMVIEQLEGETNRDKMLVLMMLCNGTRLGETRQAKWDHIKFMEKIWYIPEANTKTRREHRVPLSDKMISFLIEYKETQKQDGYRGAFLFPVNYRAGKPISPLVANQIFKGISEGMWTSHDLRKLARTVWADLGVDYMIAERLLNHAMSKLDEAYIHTFSEVKKREAINLYHNQLCQYGLIFSFTRSSSAKQIQPIKENTSLSIA